MNAVILESILTCPRCGFAAQEAMLTDACLFFYEYRNLQDAAATERGRLLRVLLLRLGEVSARSERAQMLRLIGVIGTAAAILLVASGCTWQQAAYNVGQAWQRGSCTKLPEQTERDRCLSNANMSYADYRRQTNGTKKD